MTFKFALRRAKLVLPFMALTVALSSIACQKPQATAPDIPIRANADVKRSLGSFKSVNGSSYLMAPVESETEGGYSSKGSSRNVHNYVFFNTANESVHTLMPTNDYWVTETISFPEVRGNTQKNEPVQWFLYFIVKEDTDGDKRLTYKDNRTLAISDAAGTGFTELIADVEEVYGQAMRDSSTLFIIYRSQSKKYVAKIDLQNRKLASTKELGLEFDDLK